MENKTFEEKMKEIRAFIKATETYQYNFKKEAEEMIDKIQRYFLISKILLILSFCILFFGMFLK